jgi:hypothetical protein
MKSILRRVILQDIPDGMFSTKREQAIFEYELTHDHPLIFGTEIRIDRAIPNVFFIVRRIIYESEQNRYVYVDHDPMGKESNEYVKCLLSNGFTFITNKNY